MSFTQKKLRWPCQKDSTIDQWSPDGRTIPVKIKIHVINSDAPPTDEREAEKGRVPLVFMQLNY